MAPRHWLNRTVLGAGLASFLSDFSHEAITALLPAFLAALGAPAYALGIIEGVSDGAASFMKLLAGHYADRTGHGKEVAFAGYVVTGLFPAFLAVAGSWPVVLLARAIGWMGRGVRGPPRDAILTASVSRADLGKAFGFHRAGDTLGALTGPALALGLVTTLGLREIFWLAVVPGLLAALAFGLLVRADRPRDREEISLVASLTGLPSRFRAYLSAVLVFGLADFSHTLLIAYAAVALTPALGPVQAAAAGAGLYLIRNATYAVASYPLGALGDRFGRTRLLAGGYALAVLTLLGFALAPPSLPAFALLFSLAGIYIAAEDTLEGAVAGALAPERRRGIAFGALATVNGVGDLVSSIAIGFVFALAGYPTGFVLAAIMAAFGTALLVFGTGPGAGTRGTRAP
ncbi:MAG TPA: MFS transporter [Methanoregulaceae archaeon]|nr:MFS transporter [Methanoregulaceae archaeon]HQJ87131.1 MFS transporter [Methanoregulaceae archaeon]